MKKYKPEDYIEYRINRAIETIKEVEVHIQNRFWNTAINRMYYACFYSVNALLFREGIQVSTHNGVRQKFGKHFVKTGKFDRNLAKHFTDLYEKRNKGDYNDFYVYNEETVTMLFPTTKIFVDEILKILKF